MSKQKNILLGFFAGALAGTVFGMLYAPDKGINTRDRLSYRLDKYRNQLRDLIEQIVEGKHVPVSSAKEEGQKVIKDAKDKAEKLLSDVEELIDQIKTKK